MYTYIYVYKIVNTYLHTNNTQVYKNTPWAYILTWNHTHTHADIRIHTLCLSFSHSRTHILMHRGRTHTLMHTGARTSVSITVLGHKIDAAPSDINCQPCFLDHYCPSFSPMHACPQVCTCETTCLLFCVSVS